MVALVAITAFAVQVSRRVAADVADVATLNALADKAEFTFKGQVSVVAKVAKGDNTYCFVQDATGSTLIYANKDNKDKVAALEVGKTIAADWTGTVSIYNKLFEAIPTSTLAVTEDAAVAPTFPEVAITDITEANVNKIVKLTDVTVFGISGNNFKIQKGELTVAGYDQFTVKGADFANGMVCSEMIGAIGRYNDAIQFQPISYTVGTPAPDPAGLVVSPATGADIVAALSDANAAATAPVKNITINLAKNGAYTISGAIKTPVDLTINGNASIIDASQADVNFIELQNSSVKAMKADGTTESDHFLLSSVVVKDVTVSGLKKAIIRDTQKSLLKVLTIENSIIEASNAKPAIDFDGKGYVEQLNVKNSTIWAAASTAKNFTKYGSRPKNLWTKDGDTDVPGPYTLQGIDVQNSTFVNIASTNQHFCNNSQKGTAENVYTIKNNIFVDCGKIPNQVIVGFNGGQASATPAWDVDGNVFNATINGAMSDASAQEVSKAGKHKVGEENVDIVQNSIAAVVAFADAAHGDFTQATAKAGDPRWIQYSVAIADGIQNGTVVADVAIAKAGEIVTLTATPAEGYSLSAYDVKNGETAVAVKDNKFTMPAGDVTVGATFRVAPVNVEIAATDITEGDITAAIAAKAGEKAIKNLTITLAANTAYKVTGTMKVEGNVTITGAEGTTIDASALLVTEGESKTYNPFIQMNPFAADATLNAKDACVIDGIIIKDVTITGLPAQLIYGNKQKYLMSKILVENSVIGINGTAKKTIFDFNGGGNASEIIVNNSTLWANPSNEQNGGLFSSQSGHGSIQDLGSDKQLFAITNSTIYNIVYGKTTNSQRRNNTAGMEFKVENSIIVNSGKNGQFIVGLNGGSANSAQTYTASNNVFNFGDADVSAAEEAKVKEKVAEFTMTSINGVVAFTDAANGDFNAQLGVALAPTEPTVAVGDPRWTVTAVQVPVDIVISPADGDIAAALTAATEGKLVKNITINLTKDVTYTVGATLVAPNSITINGNGAIIDVSALEANLIEFAAKAAEDTEWTNANVSISGVTVKGLKKALFFSNSKYYYGDFSLINSVVEQAGDATTFDYTKGSVAVNFTVTCSTIYAPTATTKSLYSSQSGQKATEYKDDATQSFAFLLNTMYNLAPTKNFFTHRQNNQKWLAYGVHSNIFVNCGKSGQVIKGMNGGQSGTNPTWVISGNAFNFDGADTSAAEATGDDEEPVKESVAGIVTFTDAANGNFSGNVLLPAAATAPTGLGDPRWTITYTNAPEKLYVIGDMNNWDRTALTEMTFNAETKAFEFEFAPDKFTSFAFATKQMTADEATADPNWEDFNTNYRYSIGEGDNVAELNKALALLKVNGTVQVKPVKEGTTYKISIAWDLSTVTIAGEAAPEPEPVSVDKLFVMGTGTPKGWDGTTELTFNETTQAFEYVATVTEDTYLTFGDAEWTSWDDFNGKHRFAPAEGNTDAVLDQAVQLVLVNDGNVVLKNAGTYKISVTKDLKMTITSTGTGINSIAADKMKNATIYTVSGQRVEKAQKGLYIINGKKVVIK